MEFDKLQFDGALHIAANHVILSEARSAKSKNLRSWITSAVKSVRKSFDSVQDDKRGELPDKHQFAQEKEIIMDHGMKAAELFLSGYNCAQSVAVAFCDVTGLDEKTAARAVSGIHANIIQPNWYEVCRNTRCGRIF